MSDLFAEWNEEQSNTTGHNESSRKLPNSYKSPYGGDFEDDDDDNEDDDNTNTSNGQQSSPQPKERSNPIFNLKEHPLKISRRKGFTLRSMGIGNGIMVMGSAEGILLRCTIDAKDIDVEEIVIEPQIAIQKVFIDPSGAHSLISLENGSNYYLHTSVNRPRKISRAQGLRFSCVAWDHQFSSPNSSQSILLGTDVGTVYEGIFDGKEKLFRKVFEISNQGPIAGIQFETFKMLNGDLRCFAILTTSGTSRRSTRVFQFFGESSLESMFAQYASSEKLRFQELPGEVDNAALCFYRKNEREKASCFGVLTGEGIYLGNLTFGSSCNLDTIVTESEMISFPSTSGRKKSSRSVKDLNAIALTLTEYHIILLYPKSLQIINKLNGVVVMDKSFDSRIGRVEGMTVDCCNNSIWIYSDRRINQLKIKDEDADVWNLYMMKAKEGNEKVFEIAAAHCKTGYQQQEVMTAQADYYFDRGEYERAAAIYAKTLRSFEEVALRFIEIDHREALKVFLLQKLKLMNSKDKTQKTVICTWLIELFLEKFNALKNQTEHIDEHANLLFEFKQFLQDQKKYLDPSTTFNLIASHGRTDELVFYASLVEDFEKVVTYHVQRGEYGIAIDILDSAPAVKTEELYYKYSPELIQYKPKELVSAWKKAEILDPKRLIPALVRYTQQKNLYLKSGNHLGIDYLSHQVKQGNRDPTIHNYLLYLYAKHPDERQLIKFLRRKHGGKHLFDIAYALRICTQQEKNRACIYIYYAMGLHLEAVEKALQVDINIAKEMASQTENEEMKKKLWMLIAKHTIDAGGDVKEAMSILKESDVLKIEDILIYFPDFVIINDFKKEICESLEEYNDKIEGLKAEMRDYTDSAELIRNDMKQLRKRVTYVSGSQKCDLSKENILDEGFYLFPCGHAFHETALIEEMQKHLNSFQRQTLKNLMSQLNGLNQEKKGIHRIFNLRQNTKKTLESSEREVLQEKLDEIIASECIFCGEAMIRSINMPLISEQDEIIEGNEWRI